MNSSKVRKYINKKIKQNVLYCEILDNDGEFARRYKAVAESLEDVLTFIESLKKETIEKTGSITSTDQSFPEEDGTNCAVCGKKANTAHNLYLDNKWMATYLYCQAHNTVKKRQDLYAVQDVAEFKWLTGQTPVKNETKDTIVLKNAINKD